MAVSIEAVHNRSKAVEKNMADITWERYQERALAAFRNRDVSTARTCWRKALELAERHFERGDPRIAASRTSYGFALMRQGYQHEANAYFGYALAAWEDSWCWVPYMRPSCRQGDMESMSYDRATQDAFYAFVEKGKERTERLMHDGGLPASEHDDWATIKPTSMTDVRRLSAAVLLMPTILR